MKRIFLIDKENTGNSFLEGLEKLDNKDLVVVFHYEQSGKINNQVLEALAVTKAAVEIRKMNTHTKNAMDFQICTYLGYLYGKHGSNTEYYIVSNDKGYQAAIEFLKKHVDVHMKLEIISTCDVKKESVTKRYSILDEALNTYPKKIINLVQKGIVNTPDQSKFHEFLQKELRIDATNIYRQVKPIYKTLKSAV